MSELKKEQIFTQTKCCFHIQKAVVQIHDEILHGLLYEKDGATFTLRGDNWMILAHRP